MSGRNPRSVYRLFSLLHFLRAYSEKNGRMPSTREMASHLGVSQTAAVKLLRRLEQHRKIRREKYEHRAIALL